MSNHGDKRSVSTDALETLGTIIGDGQGRDAIHLAVEPSVAAHMLRPGEDVGFVEGGMGVCDAPLGIVDPFLKAPVKKGERFWLVVYPRQITSLRHVWSHPGFPESSSSLQEKDKSDSEAWLREFFSTNDCPDYETVMEVLVKGSSGQKDSYGYWYGGRIDGEYIHFDGMDAHGSIPPEFWDHAEIVTGKKFIDRPLYFSCSC